MFDRNTVAVLRSLMGNRIADQVLERLSLRLRTADHSDRSIVGCRRLAHIG